MIATLTVKNFGPIENVTLDLRNVNVPKMYFKVKNFNANTSNSISNVEVFIDLVEIKKTVKIIQHEILHCTKTQLL